VFQPNFAFRKRTTIGLSRVQRARKTESVFPPEYDNGGLYTDARRAPGAVGEGADMEDNELYTNAKHP